MGKWYSGVNFNNLRKALYLIYFGHRNGECNDFSTEKYKYIIPMRGAFEDPLSADFAKDTYIMYWIEEDSSLTQDDYVYDEPSENEIVGYNRQKCIANVLVRFIGAEAEQWVRALRHLTQRQGIGEILSGVCGAEKLYWTSPIIPQRVNYSGRNSEIAFDISFKLYYDECIKVNWSVLEGIDIKVQNDLNCDA